MPKTIDNDLGGTDVTFGFQTAVQIVTDAIDRLHTTAESHNRVMVRRGDGPPRRLDRHARRASPGGADAILVPERPFDIEEVVAPPARAPRARAAASRSSSSPRARRPREGDAARRATEAATDAFGHARLGGIGVALESEIERPHRL